MIIAEASDASTSPRFEKPDTVGFALVWILVFSIPWGDMFLFPFQIQASRVFTLVASAAWVVILWKRRAIRPPESVHYWILLFLLWATIHTFGVTDPDRGTRRILSYFQLFLVVLIVHQAVDDVRRYRNLLVAFVLGCTVTFCVLTVSYLRDLSQGDHRYTAPGFDPNDLAVTLVLAIPIAWRLSIDSGGWRLLARLYIPLAVLGCLMTASRGALAALSFALLFPLFNGALRFRWWAILSTISAAGCAGLALYSFEPAIVRRLSTFWAEVSAGDLNGRLDLWRRGMEAFLASPIAGSGAGSFGSAIGGERGGQLVAHNTLLGVLVEHGLVGISFFVGILASLVWRIWRTRTVDFYLWVAVLASWCIAGLTLSWENKEATWVLWGLCLACPVPSLNPWIVGERDV